VSRKIGQGGGRLTADWLKFGDCDVLSTIHGSICGTSGGGHGVGGRALIREDGNGVGAVVMGARGVVGIVLATRIDILDDGLCIWPVIRLDCRCITVSRRQNARRIGKRVQVRPLGCSKDKDKEAPRQWQATEQQYSDSPMVASWKTISKLVSSFHLILKPPLTASQSEKAAWMSLVLSSLLKPVRERILVTEADSPASEEDIIKKQE
jgi:hypothetical protein